MPKKRKRRPRRTKKAPAPRSWHGLYALAFAVLAGMSLWWITSPLPDDSSADNPPQRTYQKQPEPAPTGQQKPSETVRPNHRISAPRPRSAQAKMSFTDHPRWSRGSGSDKPKVTYWWTHPTAGLAAAASPFSNMLPVDYVGPDRCGECHTEQHAAWSEHPHRWMNAKASEDTIKGDFSGGSRARIEYRGGVATFYREQNAYLMKLVRDGRTRIYRVNRTIGSRLHQYYAGRLTSGPEPADHPIRKVDHILFFGYWLDRREWVPTVHVDREGPDKNPIDPFSQVPQFSYDRHCASCHTTHSAGDRLVRAVGRERFSAYSPHQVSFAMRDYLKQAHPDMIQRSEESGLPLDAQARSVLLAMDDLPVQHFGVSLGITCEGCHFGGRQHAADPQQPFRFFPSGPHLSVRLDEAEWGRTRANMNWICAQCHTGGRPTFANGTSTWNSTEYSDAMRGGCYDRTGTQNHINGLTCVHCHDPHQPTGKTWPKSPEDDDRSCLSCHDEFASPTRREAHTHHPSGTTGSRCMNCHMPKINEGIQDVVRTHTIFSPTDTRMLHANHPNACNLCHVQKDIDWTLDWLSKWYRNDASSWYQEEQIGKAYTDRSAAVGLGWLRSKHAPTRLVATAALTQQNAHWALKELLEALDDSRLLNRQFAQVGIEQMLDRKLIDFGYKYYMTEMERKDPLARMKLELLDSAEPAQSD